MESEFSFYDAEEIVLRQYQSESIDALRKNFEDRETKSQILASMVGSGKTICGAFLLRECLQKGHPGIFVVDRLNLLDQTSAVFDRYGIGHGVVQSGHARYRPEELIQVASIQTLARRGWPRADLIVADEVHVVYKTMVDKIAKKDARIVGLTATPFTRGLGRHYQKLVNVTTGNKLTKEGFLVPFKVWAAAEPDMTGAEVVAGEWTDEEASKRAVKIIGDVVKEYKTHGCDQKTIAFGVDVAHCEAMQIQFLAAGVNAQLYTYRTSDDERDMILREFRKPDSAIRILISVAALSRGFDVPDVGCLIMARPLKSSFAEFIQTLGRLLRAFPGKEFGIVLDLAGNFMRHYPAMVEFFEEGAQTLDDGKPKPNKPAIAAEKKPRKCSRCKYLPVLGECCPACGHIMKRISSVKHEEGSLGAFDGSKVLKLDRESKCTLFAELRFIGMDEGYKPGWAAWKYRAITGVWPNAPGLRDVAPQPPRRETLAAVTLLSRQKPVARRIEPAQASPLELDLFA